MSTKNKSITVKARFRQSEQFFNTVEEHISTYEIQNRYPKGYASIKVKHQINETDFYKCYLYLKAGLSKTVYTNDNSDEFLTAVNILYMATIMSKPLDYSMPAKSKKNIQHDLAKELDKTQQSAYNAINRLKKAGFLVVSEDDLIVPNDELQNLRVVTKAHLEKLGCYPMSYLLNFVVVKNAEV
jgi:DNA-binding MarR family transcriptional regulator